MNEMRRNAKKRPAVKKVFALLLALSMFCALLAGCGKKEETDNVTVRVGAMSGPTAMGMVKLMKDAEDGTAKGTYEFADLSTDPSTFVAPLTKGDIDIAAVPSNLASVIYNNTNGGVQILAVNTLGVLNIVERGDSVQSIKDLAGKKLYATGQGATPEYTLRHILKQNGIDPDSGLTIQWCADTTEALSYIANDSEAIAMLPQPFATAAMGQVDGLRVAIDLNDAWTEIEDCDIVTGVVVARTDTEVWVDTETLSSYIGESFVQMPEDLFKKIKEVVSLSNTLRSMPIFQCIYKEKILLFSVSMGCI